MNIHIHVYRFRKKGSFEVCLSGLVIFSFHGTTMIFVCVYKNYTL